MQLRRYFLAYKIIWSEVNGGGGGFFHVESVESVEELEHVCNARRYGGCASVVRRLQDIKMIVTTSLVTTVGKENLKKCWQP